MRIHYNCSDNFLNKITAREAVSIRDFRDFIQYGAKMKKVKVEIELSELLYMMSKVGGYESVMLEDFGHSIAAYTQHEKDYEGGSDIKMYERFYIDLINEEQKNLENAEKDSTIDYIDNYYMKSPD
ncbi:hypothetical protein QUB80_14055 [Chlorogloeopsis sp. ULAP01]|uniref:hypothetical protein n=1 Tax=Chlorogloeopsis sp. ULAP01 TaxID=3056483 RepID=UPI0025AAE729|nr:hypothetical protein [Chlorogloeopsis sp. ULAP01]MDM9381825.1 hypothetical protein [Chlorogloeopsis sp. ULAP01]